jgi:phosphatidylglycerol:prolipoprotein diacylglycerol transferase
MHPVLIEIGSCTIRWYGVMIATAVLVGLWLAGREGLRKGLEKRPFPSRAFSVPFESPLLTSGELIIFGW